MADWEKLDLAVLGVCDRLDLIGDVVRIDLNLICIVISHTANVLTFEEDMHKANEKCH